MSGTVIESVEHVSGHGTRPKKLTVICSPGLLITNDHTHNGHDESNPDDGSVSEAALALGEKLKEFGLITKVERVEE